MAEDETDNAAMRTVRATGRRQRMVTRMCATPGDVKSVAVEPDDVAHLALVIVALRLPSGARVTPRERFRRADPSGPGRGRTSLSVLRADRRNGSVCRPSCGRSIRCRHPRG